MPNHTRKNAAVVIRPRLGKMTPAEFRAIAEEVLGGRGWQRILAAGTGWSLSTITRYLQGALPVPRHVALLLEVLATLRRHELPLPEGFEALGHTVRPQGLGTFEVSGSPDAC